MKKIAIALAVAGCSLGFALASELEAQCEAYAAENGTDPSGCSCIAETADEDVAMELSAVTAPEDIETLSDNAKAAIKACWPDA